GELVGGSSGDPEDDVGLLGRRDGKGAANRKAIRHRCWIELPEAAVLEVEQVAVAVDDVGDGFGGAVGAGVTFEGRDLNRRSQRRARLGRRGGRAGAEKEEQRGHRGLPAAHGWRITIPRIRGIYHGSVVYAVTREAAGPRDLTPVRPVRGQPASPPPVVRRPGRRASPRRRIRGVQSAVRAGAADSHRDGAANGDAAYDCSGLPQSDGRAPPFASGAASARWARSTTDSADGRQDRTSADESGLGGDA